MAPTVPFLIMSSMEYTDSDKGAPLLVVNGKYEGREGWFHDGRVQPKKMVYVILKATDDSRESSTRLRRDSVREVHFDESPQSHTQALLKEHKDIIVDMQKLVEKLSEFEDYAVNTELMELFWKMWQDEKQKHGQSNIRRVRSVRSWSPAAAPTAAAAPTTTATPPMPAFNNAAAPHVIPDIPDGWVDMLPNVR